MILAGRVKVNEHVVDTLPVLADPRQDVIRVDGRRIRTERTVYYLLNKPSGVVCTQRDPSGRTKATDLLVGVKERVFPVGRLDADSTGLLLMTNDGELAQRLTHPRYGMPKTYRAEVGGRIEPADVEKLRKGIWLSEGKTGPARVRIVRRGHRQSLLEMTLREGRNRQVRRMLARLGHPVRRLSRTRMGRLSIHGLGAGKYRPLSREEVAYLQAISRPKQP